MAASEAVLVGSWWLGIGLGSLRVTRKWRPFPLRGPPTRSSSRWGFNYAVSLNLLQYFLPQMRSNVPSFEKKSLRCFSPTLSNYFYPPCNFSCKVTHPFSSLPLPNNRNILKTVDITVEINKQVSYLTIESRPRFDIQYTTILRLAKCLEASRERKKKWNTYTTT